MVVLGSVGLVMLVRSPAHRRVVLAWFAFGVTLLAVFVPKPFQPFRNLLPLVPLFCIAAASALDQALLWASRAGRTAFWNPIVALVLAVILIEGGVTSFKTLRKRIRHHDSRIQVVVWL